MNVSPTTTPSIQSADESTSDRLMATLVLSLGSDPLMRWMCPDPQQYLVWWREMARAYVSRSLEHRTVHYAPGYAGVAFWLPPGVAPDEDKLLPLFVEHIQEDRQERLFAILEGMANSHPDEPHWHLALIGVDPAHQNHGIGSALLRHALATCDRDGTLAYVESSNPRNLPFYERHGFVTTGTICVDGAPTLWPMVRRPRPL